MAQVVKGFHPGRAWRGMIKNQQVTIARGAEVWHADPDTPNKGGMAADYPRRIQIGNKH